MAHSDEQRSLKTDGFLGLVNLGNVGRDLTQIFQVSPRQKIRPSLPPTEELPDEHEVIKLLSWRRPIGQMVGRDREKAELKEWAASGSMVRVRLLSGPGGSGKSRLAFEIARELQGSGEWSAGTVEANADGDIESDDRKLLIVIDYAEQYRSQVLSFLERLTRSGSPNKAIRVLLLSRHSIDWWRRNIDAPAIHDILDFQECEVRRLSDHDAVLCYGNVTERLAKHLKREVPKVEPDDIIKWINLDSELHALPLLVTAAAIQGVLMPERALELSGSDILGALANRERLRIDLIGNARKDTGQDIGWASRLTALGILTGGITGAIARDLAEHEPSLGLPSVKFIESAIGELPSWSDDRLQPVSPDLVGAKLLIDVLEGNSYLAPTWLIAVIRHSGGGNELGERLARLAYDVRAISGGTVNAFAEILIKAVRANTTAAELIAAAMRNLRPPDLLPVLLEASKRLVDTGSLQKVERVRLLDRYAAQLNDAGDFKRALEISELAVQLAEQLGNLDPAFDRNIIAGCLNSRSNLRARVRRYAEALSDIEAAVALRRELVKGDSSKYLPDLASSLQNLALRRSEMGDSPEADEAIREALVLYQQLWSIDPDRHAREIARSMHNYSTRLNETGNRRAAIEAAREAVKRRQDLAQESPERDEIELTYSLHNLANRLGDVAEYDEAIQTAEMLLTRRERLMAAHPKRVGNDLLYVYQSLSNFLYEAGRLPEAIQMIERGVKRARGLAIQTPEIFELGLGFCLVTLTWRLMDNGDLNAALATSAEATALLEAQAKLDPARCEPDLAYCLHVRSRCLRESGGSAEAMEVLARAIAIRRSLAAANPIRFGAELSNSLRQMAWFLSASEAWPEAHRQALEAMEFARGLAGRLPSRFEPELAVALTELHWRCKEAGMTDEALAAAEEAVRIYQKYEDTEFLRMGPLLAQTLRAQAETLADVSDPFYALKAIERALEIHARLPAQRQVRRDSERCDCEWTLVRIRLDLGEVDEATGLIDQIIKSRRAARRSPRYEADLAAALNMASHLRRRAGQRAQALREAEEALQLRRGLARSHPDRHNSDLCASLRSTAEAQAQVGHTKAALISIEEGAALRSVLSVRGPKLLRRDLAWDLWTLCSRHIEARNHGRALQAMEEAVGHFRELAAVCPRRFSFDLGRALIALSARRQRAHDSKGALHDAAEGLRRILSASRQSPTLHQHGLTNALRDASWLRDTFRQPAKALRLANKAERLCQAMAKSVDRPSVSAEHAWACLNLSHRQNSARVLRGARASARIAVDLWRDLAAQAPAQYEPDLAVGLRAMYALLDEADAPAATPTYWELLQLYRRLAVKDPTRFGPSVAEILLTRLSAETDEIEALGAAAKAIDLLRRSAPENFSAEFNLSWALAQKADALEALGDDRGAVSALREAVDIDERLLARDPDGLVGSLVSNLMRLAEIAETIGAMNVTVEAITRARSLSRQYPHRLSRRKIEEVEDFEFEELGRTEQYRRQAFAIGRSSMNKMRIVWKTGTRRVYGREAA